MCIRDSVLDYEGNRRRLLQDNLAEVINEIDAAWMRTKITNFCDLYGFSEQEVRDAILREPILVAYFAKDPRKQKCDEKLAADFIEKIDGITDFRVLPSSGEEALCVARGKIHKPSAISSEAKSIDFYWKYKEREFYAMHKYTKDANGGGSQGSVYKEIEGFVSQAHQTHPCLLYTSPSPRDS